MQTDPRRTALPRAEDRRIAFGAADRPTAARPVRTLALAMLLSVGPAGALHGQSAAAAGAAPAEAASGAGRDPRIQRLEERIFEEDRIRVHSGGQLLEVRSPVFADGRLSYSDARLPAGERRGSDGGRIGAPVDPIPLEAIERVQVRRSNAGRGSLIGLGIGTALGLFYVASTSGDEWFGPSDTGEGILMVGSMAASGAAWGALIGSLSKGWRTVYERPSAGVR